MEFRKLQKLREVIKHLKGGNCVVKKVSKKKVAVRKAVKKASKKKCK